MGKNLHALYIPFDLKITAQVNHQSVNFLDVTFGLTNEGNQPYRTPNNAPVYIDSSMGKGGYGAGGAGGALELSPLRHHDIISYRLHTYSVFKRA